MTEATAGRTRTISWEDPMALAAAAAGRTGLEFLTAMGTGELPLPPICALLNITGVEAAEGRVVFSIEPDESMYNPIGVVHGGVHATVLDAAMGCAVHTTLPAGVAYTTLGIEVKYARPFTLETGPAEAVGEVQHRGGRFATATGRLLRRSDGKLIASATTTCAILEALGE